MKRPLTIYQWAALTSELLLYQAAKPEAPDWLYLISDCFDEVAKDLPEDAIERGEKELSDE